MKASVRFDHQLLAVEGEHTVHAMLELQAPSAPTERPRPPLHLALVLDRSGSMSGPKLEHAKEAAAFLVRRMSPSDELALVVYDDHVDLLAPMSTVESHHVAGIVQSIRPGGSTNLSGGWLKGLEEAQRATGDGPKKVLLLTDGLANVGVTDSNALVSMATNARGAGVGTTTIGFGEGFDEHLLTGMARAGGGHSYYAASPEDAPRIFAEEFDDLASLVAQNVSVELRPSEDVKMLGVLNDYPQLLVPGGVQIQLGDAYSDEFRRVVFELHIPMLARLGVAKVADIVVRYVSVGDEIATHELAIPLRVNLVSADEASTEQADQEVVEEVLILKAARAQQEARKRADTGDFEGAQSALRLAADELRKAAPNSSRAEELLQEAETLDEHQNLAAPATWGAAEAKSMHYDAWRKTENRRRPRREPPGEQNHGH